MKILFAAPESAWSGFLQKLRELNPGFQFEPSDGFQITTLKGFDAVIPTMTRITAADLESADRLKLIQQVGVGTEGIDIEAAHARGIKVANIPSDSSGNADSVAELGIYLMIALARHANLMRKNIQQGVIGNPFGMALKGRTVGLVGLGGIGRALIKRLKPFDVKFIGVKRSNPESVASELGLDWAGSMEQLDQLLSQSDFVVLAIPDSPETHGLLNRERLLKMKPGAFLINLGRGGLIPRDDLLYALENKLIQGAGLDVFWQEPPDPDDPIFEHNVIATPHVAGSTDISIEGMLKVLSENLRRLHAGEPVLHRL